ATQALDALTAFRRERDTPVVLFTYLNPILAYGEDRFLEDALEAGADGLLLTDLPLDADPVLEATIEASELALVRLIAPTTSPARAALVAARSQGFLYYISRTGVTGARESLREELAREIEALRAAAAVPIAVGFGISSAEQAAQVARVADGIVVGSAFIERLERDEADALAFIGDLLRAVNRDDRFTAERAAEL
ncbi:MAG: tryptophan synthase subunit alpha, partial [Longimicrobiales bacterium]